MLNEAIASGTIARPGLGLSLDLAAVDIPPWLRGDYEGLPPCLTSDPDLFFPWTYGLQCRDQIAEARALCRECPLRDACLAWATPKADLDGIWAATTPPERRRLRTGKAA